ncbi:class I SAM-dependent methyltransferase [Winogradskyella sp.]|uniref:class I SAM-dependent methyltransferase n=1 Tax=Winogradskyella sp. TaxID=1883156 RepID=UPI0025CBFD83|nr:class I SAM-dependent methyltransferase [Winogradskyella sp.]
MASIKVKFVKFLMNIFPNKPKYQENHFVQEIFRHEKYTSLSQQEKEIFLDRLVNLNIKEARRKPFDLFFPSHSFKDLLIDKKVLDLGCSIGGTTIQMGEDWKVKEFQGIDVSEESIAIGNRFASNFSSDTVYGFSCSYAEKMSFADESFDAIVSDDTIEHVRSVKETLLECKRILKKDGVAYIVFPSFKLPFGGAHIGSVTKTPFLEWFFSPKTINGAYQEIVAKWGDDLNWYKPRKESEGDWAVVKGGIGVNGTTYKKFLSTANDVGFKEISFERIPLLLISNTASKYPIVKFMSSMLKPLLSIDFFKDYLSHRLVFVLKK